MALSVIGTGCTNVQKKETGTSSDAPVVYFVKDITPGNLLKVYDALQRKATGKVAVKLSTGEPGNNNYLQPALIKDLVQTVNGTIIECNTAYGGGRADTENHLKAAADHGFTAIAPVDIMDAEEQVALPVKGGKHLQGISSVRTISTTISPLFSPISKVTRWVVLAVLSRILLSALLPRKVRLGYIQQAKQ